MTDNPLHTTSFRDLASAALAKRLGVAGNAKIDLRLVRLVDQDGGGSRTIIRCQFLEEPEPNIYKVCFGGEFPPIGLTPGIPWYETAEEAIGRTRILLADHLVPASPANPV